MRLHLLGAPDGTIRSVIPAPADDTGRDVARRPFAIALRGGETIICDKGYAGAEFARHAANTYGAAILRPARKTEPANGLHLSGIRQRIESSFRTLEDQLGLEAHRARTLHGLRARIASKLLADSAGIWLNWLTGRPTRSSPTSPPNHRWHQPSSAAPCAWLHRRTSRAGHRVGGVGGGWRVAGAPFRLPESARALAKRGVFLAAGARHRARGGFVELVALRRIGIHVRAPCAPFRGPRCAEPVRDPRNPPAPPALRPSGPSGPPAPPAPPAR
jgi:hypothetical protein